MMFCHKVMVFCMHRFHKLAIFDLAVVIDIAVACVISAVSGAQQAGAFADAGVCRAATFVALLAMSVLLAHVGRAQPRRGNESRKDEKGAKPKKSPKGKKKGGGDDLMDLLG